jgi:hypothetical protein
MNDRLMFATDYPTGILTRLTALPTSCHYHCAMQSWPAMLVSCTNYSK